MRIVYVEDNDQNYRLVMRILMRENADYQLERAADGESGLQLITEEPPDLVLMDINLPDIDGLEVTRRLKARPNLSTIPIVALTANAMVGDQERILAAGCDGYLRKPISRSELREVLDRYATSVNGAS
ncbi:MAG: response regulator [Chloroflexi bacterium]|nr:response regulator [Chloroflexota bacterium]